MKRTKLVVGLCAVMAVMLVAFSAPALADNGGNNNNNGNHHNDNNHNDNFNIVRHDNDNFNGFRHDNDFRFVNDNLFDDIDFDDLNDEFFVLSPFFFNGFDDSCPFAGDFEGAVTVADCFD